MDLWNYLEVLTRTALSGPFFSISILIIIINAYWYLTIPSRIPPGPMGLPLLGYLPFLGNKPHLKFMDLGKKYGPIFSFYLGCRLVIVLNNYESIKEAFINQADIFTGRPIGFNLKFFRSSKDTKSISMTDGRHWKEHRRFIIRYLRDAGMCKDTIEPQIMDEIQRFITVIQSYGGSPIDFSNLLAFSVCNNVTNLILGRRFEYDDPWFLSMKLLNDELVHHNTVNLRFAFPLLQQVSLFDKFTGRTMRQALDNIQHALEVVKKDDQNNLSEGSYAGAFMIERQRRGNHDDFFNDHSLVQNTRSLMSAGTETTANTLLWAIIYMMLHPDVQRKARQEVDTIIGDSRVPTFKDRYRTPYLEATICEIQRMATLVPLNVPHRNLEETELFGYRIPKSTYIVSNLFGVQMDPKYWESPEEFRPERFIDKDGTVKKHEQFVVFSLGKRRCLGEPLARMELYLYLATMLQNFIFESPSIWQPSTDFKLGLTLRPKRFLTCAVPRRQLV